MYNYRVIWINEKGKMFDRESCVTYKTYDLTWNCCMRYLKAHNVKTGKVFITKNGQILDEIMIDV